MTIPENYIGFLVNDVSRLMRRNFNRQAEGQGLSISQWRALAYLSRQDGVKQVTLAETLEIQPITLARLIDRLEEAGIVVRRSDSDEGHATRIYLTPHAQPLLEKLWEIAKKTEENTLANLSEEARAALVKSLLQAKQNLLSDGDAEDEEDTKDSESSLKTSTCAQTE